MPKDKEKGLAYAENYVVNDEEKKIVTKDEVIVILTTLLNTQHQHMKQGLLTLLYCCKTCLNIRNHNCSFVA